MFAKPKGLLQLAPSGVGESRACVTDGGNTSLVAESEYRAGGYEPPFETLPFETLPFEDVCEAEAEKRGLTREMRLNLSRADEYCPTATTSPPLLLFRRTMD